MPAPQTTTANTRSADSAPAARRRKRTRALTAAQELLFFCVTAAIALSTEAAVVLKFTAIVE
jgi:hypothetical protein